MKIYLAGDSIVQNYEKEEFIAGWGPVSYTHLRAHETDSYLVCRLLLEKKKTKKEKANTYSQ